MRNPIYFVIAIDSGKILPQDSIVRRAYALMPLAVEFIYQMVLPIKKKKCIAMKVTIRQPNSNAFSCATLQFFKCTPTIKIQRDSSSVIRRFLRHKAAAVNVFTSFEVVLPVENLSHPRKGFSGVPRTLTRMYNTCTSIKFPSWLASGIGRKKSGITGFMTLNSVTWLRKCSTLEI